MKTYTISGLTCQVEQGPRAEVCYILSYGTMDEGWMQQAVRTYGYSIVVISNIDWDASLSPWPAEGQPPGDPPFRGEARRFLDELAFSVIPQIEDTLGLDLRPRRTLVGISMSGLFALWAWLECDEFDDMGSISGSFWYPGFSQWVCSHPVDQKTGKVYISLGNKESQSPVKAFRSVATDTEIIVETLRTRGVAVEFQWNPGTHFSPVYPRLNRALQGLAS